MTGRGLVAGRRCLTGAFGAFLALSIATYAQQPPRFRTDANTVAVFATVTDRDGRLVAGLTRDDFEIYSDGDRQPITVFDLNPQPISTLLLLDRSGSVHSSSRLVELAVDQFVARMRPRDKARIGTFSYVTQIEPRAFTHDRGELLVALRTLAPQGGPTPLWNTVDEGIALLQAEDGRRVVLLFTDGYDQPQTLIKVSFDTVLERARAADVMVYSLGLDSGVPGRTAPIQGPGGGLEHLSAQTGGGYFEIDAGTDLSTTFARVADELHSQYALGFVPEKLDGKRHSLRVRLKRDDLRVRSRLGYVAPNRPTGGFNSR